MTMKTETEKREAEVTKRRLKTEGATLVTVVSLWVAFFMAPSWFARVLILAAWAAVILFRLVTSRLELAILLAARSERSSLPVGAMPWPTLIQRSH